jgi:hypothetical protein
LRLNATPDDLVEVNRDASLHIRRDSDSGRLLRSVVATVWAALDDGHTVSDDDGTWRRLEEQVGLSLGR